MEDMKFVVYYYKNGELFSSEVYKNARNKKQAIAWAKKDAESLGCDKYEVVKVPKAIG